METYRLSDKHIYTTEIKDIMALRQFILLITSVLFFSCSNKEGVDLECEAASEAAKEYYSLLTQGKSDEFINGFARVNQFPDDYRKAFDSNTEDFLEIQKDRHGGIAVVEVCSAVRDSVNNTINVFLTLSYGDSTRTKVVVPMIKNKDKWLMR